MRYNQYLYWLSLQAVPITDICSKNSISAADIITDPIIGTSLLLHMLSVNVLKCFVSQSVFIYMTTVYKIVIMSESILLYLMVK